MKSLLPGIGSTTDAGSTITAGGTAQDALAANANRRWLFVQNVDAAEDLYVNLGADATTGSIRLAPGRAYENPPHFCPDGRVSVLGATTGHRYVAKEA